MPKLNGVYRFCWLCKLIPGGEKKWQSNNDFKLSFKSLWKQLPKSHANPHPRFLNRFPKAFPDSSNDRAFCLFRNTDFSTYFCFLRSISLLYEHDGLQKVWIRGRQVCSSDSQSPNRYWRCFVKIYCTLYVCWVSTSQNIEDLKRIYSANSWQTKWNDERKLLT